MYANLQKRINYSICEYTKLKNVNEKKNKP